MDLNTLLSVYIDTNFLLHLHHSNNFDVLENIKNKFDWQLFISHAVRDELQQRPGSDDQIFNFIKKHVSVLKCKQRMIRDYAGKITTAGLGRGETELYCILRHRHDSALDECMVVRPPPE